MNAANVSDTAHGSVSATRLAATKPPVTMPASCASVDDPATRSAATFTTDHARHHDFKAITKDLQSLAKAKPGVALAGAVIIGFVAGRLFSRS